MSPKGRTELEIWEIDKDEHKTLRREKLESECARKGPTKLGFLAERVKRGYKTK